MPLSHSQAQALPGESSGSRKRTYAEITRSESRSQSPRPPSKRRRTFFSHRTYRVSTTPESDGQTPNSARFVGDGLDHRQPIMSGSSSSQQPQDSNTIDLTLDDDSPPPPSNWFAPRAPPFPPQAPPSPPQNNSLPQQVIDLSSDDDDNEDTIDEEGVDIQLNVASPEVQFIRERQLPQPTSANHDVGRRPHLPTPPAMRGHFGSMANFLRDMTRNVFRNSLGPRDFPEEALNRIDGLLNHPAVVRGGLEQAPNDFVDEYEGLEMDYGRTAFPIGADVLIIDEPHLPHPGPHRPNESVYKEPPPAKEGFTRNYEEDDMLICGFCGDELATGKTEQKQQVWIIKQCGHAYCGDCAHNRSVSKAKNKDNKRNSNRKTNTFKTCTVPDCRKAVDSKTKMFQIYL